MAYSNFSENSEPFLSTFNFNAEWKMLYKNVDDMI